MPEVRVGDQQWTVATGSNLLDVLNQADMHVPYSCRAGRCHACLVRCAQGEPLDALPDALADEKRQQGWRLACQCRVVEDLQVEVFNVQRDGLPAPVCASDWLSPTVLRLRLQPVRPLRYRAAQQMVVWMASGVARPCSLASRAGDDPFIELHLDCRQADAFTRAAGQLQIGDSVRLGELRGGALQYDPDWHERPLLLMAAGTGLAPLWGVLREALSQEHQGPIRLIHLAAEVGEHYLAPQLASLEAAHPGLQVQLTLPQDLPNLLADLRLLSRRTMALICADPASAEAFARRLYLAGLPRNQVLAQSM